MSIIENLDKDNLHHAYLIEGKTEEILPEVFKFIESLGVNTDCLLYTSPSPRDRQKSRMPSSA